MYLYIWSFYFSFLLDGHADGLVHGTRIALDEVLVFLFLQVVHHGLFRVDCLLFGRLAEHVAIVFKHVRVFLRDVRKELLQSIALALDITFFLELFEVFFVLFQFVGELDGFVAHVLKLGVHDRRVQVLESEDDPFCTPIGETLTVGFLPL